jgi:carboxylesterase type B
VYAVSINILDKMKFSLPSSLLVPASLAILSSFASAAEKETRSASLDALIATVKNGSYQGVHNAQYNQDFFLGIPYSQPPVGDYRFHVPEPLNSSWTGIKNATQYGPECIGYGSDTWVLGNNISEDCLTLNVVRPSGIANASGLPVLFWIHGGGFSEGGSRDPRYNQSFIVQRSVEIGKPIIGVSVNYRLSGWGFLWGEEIAKAGASNLGLRDQRLALHWIQENIAAFGGDPTKVTIQGESAGAASIGVHLVAYGGRDDGLFRAAIAESGGPTAQAYYVNASTFEPNYQKIVQLANCTAASDTLQCLRTVPTDSLSNIFNTTGVKSNGNVVIDGDLLPASATTLTKNGSFVKVPFLIGTNFDEGTMFGVKGINTTDEFIASIKSNAPGLNDSVVNVVTTLYPDIPEIGIPATLHGRPPNNTIYGYQWKRAASYGGDLYMHTGRRISAQSWAKYGVPAYTYHFNVLVHGVTAYVGSTHFQEVAFVFDNVNGVGYNNSVSVDPFAQEPATFPKLASIMSGAWASFVYDTNPNINSSGLNAAGTKWPQYKLDNPQNIVFDVNATGLAYAEPDIYRAEAINYMAANFDTLWGR